MCSPPGKPHSLWNLCRSGIFSIGCYSCCGGPWLISRVAVACVFEKLVLPAHIGRSGCLLLGWVGTELACPEGHGLLHVTETDVCWLDPSQWTRLDESWASLFSEKIRDRGIRVKSLRALRNPVRSPAFLHEYLMKCQQLSERRCFNFSSLFCEFSKGRTSRKLSGVIFGLPTICPECGRETDRVKRCRDGPMRTKYTEGVDFRSRVDI